MPAPLAYHITWHTYGSWLPGDSRGWVKDGIPGIQAPDAKLQTEVEASLSHDRPLLSLEQREIVERTIREHCTIRNPSAR